MDLKKLGIDAPGNKEKLAIVVVGYNKVDGLERLLSALNNSYYESQDIPLIISIDASGNEKVYSMVKAYQWKHGMKYLNIEEKRMGLKNHIFQCASLSKYFKGVIILEDDLLVSPYFYHYSTSVLDKYGNEEKVAGIALYKNEFDGFTGVPLQFIHNGFDVFASQTVCSWGEIWNERMWNEFSEWLAQWEENFEGIDMPSRIKGWTRAWSKYVYAYIIEKDKYYIYPHEPVTTNFNDAGGEHGGGDISIFQVSLLQGRRNYQLGAFSELEKYDVYAYNKDIQKWLNIEANELDVDFYGLKEHYNGHYILSVVKLPYERIKGFSLSMRPWELNIKYGIAGDDIVLYYKENNKALTIGKRKFGDRVTAYYLRNFNFSLLETYLWKRIKLKIKKLFIR